MSGIEGKIKDAITSALEEVGILNPEVELEHPSDLAHGDFATNVALRYAKERKENPREFAQSISGKIDLSEIEKIEVAGPGFINFTLSRDFLTDSLNTIIKAESNFGKSDILGGQTVMIEYTDPNAFKAMHIGHLMSNMVGESLARLLEYSGAHTVRACYQGDIGPHVAKAIWGMQQLEVQMPLETDSLSTKADFLGRAYALGATTYQDNEEVRSIIDTYNVRLYEKSDTELNRLYEIGRKWSLDYLEKIYARLGTKFSYYFFESQTAPIGKKIVEEGVLKGIFEESDGAIIFPGERYGLHSRVFVTSRGTATYEAKDLALPALKYQAQPYDKSIIITANEQDGYFQVVLKALELLAPKLANKTTHISHGMLKLPTGKMSSRTGDVITAESFLAEAVEHAYTIMKGRNMPEVEKKYVAEHVALAAIRYSILKQKPGRDIIYDKETAFSFEGDSGPYLQYTAVRAGSVLAEGANHNVYPVVHESENTPLEHLLYRLPEVVEDSMRNNLPTTLLTFLTEVAREFNTYYARNKIINLESRELTEQRLALVQAVRTVLENGLYVLGIQIPERM